MILQSKLQQSLLDLFLNTIFAFIVFYLVFDIRVLNPTNTGWLSNYSDVATGYVAWEIFRHDAWDFPLGMNPKYGLELSSNLVFSDSLGWISIILKCFNKILPEFFQFHGIWILMVLWLQGYFAIKILRHKVQDNYTIYLSSLFFLFSCPMLWRLNGHFTLMAHWTILCALYLLIIDKVNWQRKIYWMLLIILTSSIHIYLLLMIFFIWITDCFLKHEDYLKSWKSIFLEIMLIFGSIIFSLWILGVFPLNNVNAPGYGHHHLNILSPIISESIKGFDKWSFIIPSIPHGQGDYEGFAFLGSGGILLVIISLMINYKYFIKRLSNKKGIFIFILSLFLIILALSNTVRIGPYFFEIPLYDDLKYYLSTFRSSGRFFWPVYYLIFIFCLFAIFDTKRIKNIKFIITICVFVQVIDTSAGWKKLSLPLSKSSIEDWQINDIYLKPAIIKNINKYQNLRRAPAAVYGPDWNSINGLAIKYNKGTDFSHIARISNLDLKSHDNNLKEKIRNGKIDKSSMYFVNKEFSDYFATYNPSLEIIYLEKNVYLVLP